MTAASAPVPTAVGLIAEMQMQPHPEGGHWCQTWLGPSVAHVGGDRPVGTAIAFLLQAGERSHWHRLDADEVWLYQAGDAVLLETWTGSADDPVVAHVVGPPGAADGGVPGPRSGAGLAERALGAWTLVGCTMAPGFSFSGFELAPPDWCPHP